MHKGSGKLRNTTEGEDEEDEEDEEEEVKNTPGGCSSFMKYRTVNTPLSTS